MNFSRSVRRKAFKMAPVILSAGFRLRCAPPIEFDRKIKYGKAQCSRAVNSPGSAGCSEHEEVG
jgi:hypothetical protein